MKADDLYRHTQAICDLATAHIVPSEMTITECDGAPSCLVTAHHVDGLFLAAVGQDEHLWEAVLEIEGEERLRDHFGTADEAFHALSTALKSFQW